MMALNPTVFIEELKDFSYNLLNSIQGCFCQTDTTLKLNGRSFKILELLGEGGFSYVYLARDIESTRLFALKKIRCPLGSESVKNALKEVEAYKRFKHPNIIRILDSCVIQDKEDLDAKIIYLFLPYYKQSVQDIININSINGTKYPEQSMLNIFLGTCSAVSAMHSYISGPAAPQYPPSPSTSRSPSVITPSTPKPSTLRTSIPIAEHDEDEEELPLGVTGVGEAEALISRIDTGGDIIDDDDIIVEGDDHIKPQVSIAVKDGTVLPWAHRDIKPANIMLSDETPILMDFGSALPARIEIPTRSIALEQQDLAAECSSMPFRAPELFDVKTGTTLSEAVDIWSLGCTLYAMAYNTSPFETVQQSEHGGSIAMAAMNGKFSFPSNDTYSEGFKELIRGMLKVKVAERPNIHEVIEQTKALINSQ